MEESKDLIVGYKIFRSLVYVSLLLEFFLLPLQIGGVKEQGHHLPAIRDDRILGGQQLICR